MPTAVAGRSGDQLRNELLAAATDFLSRRLAVTPPSLREMARACGVSATAVYRHFPSQQALLDAIAQLSLASLEVALDDGVGPAGVDRSPLASVKRMAVTYVSWAVENPGAYQLLFEGRDLLEGVGPIDAGIHRLQLRLESAVAGFRVEDVAAVPRAELLWIALHGLVVTRIRKTTQVWERAVTEDAVSMVEAFLCSTSQGADASR